MPEIDVKNTLMGEKVKEKKKGIDEDINFGQPVDTGWSWVINICAFLNISTIFGHNCVNSVLFVDYMEEFGQTASVMSLMFTVNALSSSLAAIVVSNVIMARFDVRQISVTCAIIFCSTSVMLSQAPNVIIFLLLGVSQGSAFGCLFICPMSLIGYYFKKRRSLAASISSCGFCVAFVAFPMLTEYLREQFGLRGCLLLIGGLESHLVAINMLLRPVQSYRRAPKTKQKPSEEEALNSCPHADDNTTDNHTEDMSGDSMCLVSDILCTEDNSKSVVLKNYNVNKEDDRNGNGVPRLNEECEDGRVDVMDHRRSRGDSVSRSSDIYSRRQSLQLNIASKTGDVPYYVNEGDEDDDSDHEVDTQKKKRKKKCSPKKIVDLSLFKLWIFRMLAAFSYTSAFANYMMIYMPTFALTNGISKADAAMFMTIGGVLDLLTRIVAGFLADFDFFKKSRVVALSLMVTGLTCQLARFFNTYALFMVFAIVVGIFGGFRQNFFHTIMIDYVGVDNTAKGYGLCTTLITLSLSMNHPILGAILDKTGNFIIPLHYVGAAQFLASILMLCEPIFLALDAKKKEKEGRKLHLKSVL